MEKMGSKESEEWRVQDRDQITPVAIKMRVKNTNKELNLANKRFANKRL